MRLDLSNFMDKEPHSIPVHKLTFPPTCKECLHVLEDCKNQQHHFKDTM